MLTDVLRLLRQTDINLSDDGLACIPGDTEKKKRKWPTMAQYKAGEVRIGRLISTLERTLKWEELSIPKRADVARRPVNGRQARYAQHPTPCDPAPPSISSDGCMRVLVGAAQHNPVAVRIMMVVEAGRLPSCHQLPARQK